MCTYIYIYNLLKPCMINLLLLNVLGYCISILKRDPRRAKTQNFQSWPNDSLKSSVNLFTLNAISSKTPSPLLHLAHIPILKLVCYLCLEWTPEKPEFCVWACDRVSLSRRAALRDRGGTQRVVLKGVQVTFADILCLLGEGWRRTKARGAAPIERDPICSHDVCERAACAPISSHNLLLSRVVSYIYAPGRSRYANNTLFATPDVTLISLSAHCIGWSPAEQMESHKRHFLA